MQYRYFFLLIILLLVNACNTSKDKYITLESEKHIDSLYFQVDRPGYNWSMGGKIVQIDGRKVFITTTGTNHSQFPELLFYDLSTQKLFHSISLNFNKGTSGYLFNDFIFLSKDSIILLYNSYVKKQDSSMVMVDYEGNIKKLFELNNPLFPSTKYPLNKEKANVFIGFRHSTGLFAKNKILLDFYLYNFNEFGTDSFFIKKYPLLGYYDLIKDTFIANNKIWFPYVTKGDFYPSEAYYISKCISPKGNLIIGFSYTPEVFEWNIETERIDTFRMTSLFVDTIYPEKQPVFSQFSEIQPHYYGPFYIKKYQMYIRYIDFPKETYGDFKTIVVFADQNFNYLGEAYNTYAFRRSDILNNDTALWGFDVSLENGFGFSEYDDKIKLVNTEYFFKKLDTLIIGKAMRRAYRKKQEQIKEAICMISGNDSLNSDYSVRKFRKYLIHRDINDSTFAVCILSNRGCPSCNNYLLKFLSINRNVMFSINKKPFYLIYIKEDSKQDEIKKILSEFSLKQGDKIKIDTTITYQFANPYSVLNPRLVLVENNQIISDTIYMPDNLETLIERLLNFYGMKTE